MRHLGVEGAPVREAFIEKYLHNAVKEQGGWTFKFTSPGRRNVPDRLCVLHGFVWLVEVKAPGQKPTPSQRREHKRMRRFGLRVDVVDSYEAVDLMLAEVTLL